MKNSLIEIKKKYENDLKTYGQNYKGVGWPRKKDAVKRHEVMSKLIKNKKSHNSILDLGCGLSHFYKYLNLKKFKIKYLGVDISSKMIAISRRKYPNNLYYGLDILKDHSKIPKVDYITINGLFTYKGNYSNKMMLRFVKNILLICASKAKIGISFNVFSESTDWKDKKLFYLNLKTITDFICKRIGNKFIVNHDYGLYEYTIFIYKTIR
jgi:SAM-dependent methyltransferase